MAMNEPGPEIIEDITLMLPPQPWAWVWPTVGALAAALALGWILWRLYRARKLPFQHPVVPPDVVARQRLAAIRHLIEEGRHQEFVVEVSSILREYIEARFGLKAPSLSTEEFLFEAERGSHLDPRWRESLGDFLQQCDRVKFALAHLQPPRMEVLHTTAETFIDATATAPAAAAPAERKPLEENAPGPSATPAA